MRLSMLPPILLGCVAVVTLAGCSCDAPTETSNNEAFKVVATIPAPGSTDVPVAGTIDIEFNHALRDEQAVLSESVVFFEPVNPPHVVSKVAPKRIQVQLLQPLPYGALITAVVQGLQDADNKPLHAYEFTFVTEIDIEPPFAPTPAFTYAITRDAFFDITGGREPYTYIWLGYSTSLTDSDIELERYAEGTTDPFSLAERFTVRVPLDEGDNRVGLLSEDLAGNRSEPVFLTVVRDSVPPATPVPDLAPPALTTDTLLVLSGTIESGAEVLAYLNGNLISVNASGNTWDLTLTLAEGDNAIQLRAIDDAQNVSSFLTYNVRLDTTRPVITLGSLPARTSSSCVTVSGSVNEASEIYVNGSWVQSGTTFTTCLNLTPDTTTAIEIAAFDDLGNSTQLRRHVAHGSAPQLLQILPEPGSTVTGSTGFAVHYFYDQPLSQGPAANQFTLTGLSDISALAHHRHAISVVPADTPSPGVQSLSASYTPTNNAGQTGVTLTGNTFTWQAGGTQPGLAAVTATALDNRGIAWEIDFNATNAQWFVVAATQASLTGGTLTTVVQGAMADLPLTLSAPLPWAALSITATVYSASGESTFVHQTLYPTSSYTSVGLPFADDNFELAILAAPAVTSASAWDLYVGAATESAVARLAQTGLGPTGFTGADAVPASYVAGPLGFGRAITYSATHVYVSSPGGTGCLYVTDAPLDAPTVSTGDAFACTEDTPGTRLIYDWDDDLLWSSSRSYQSGSDVGRVVAYAPSDASIVHDWRGYDDFVPLAEFRSAAGTRQWILHAGQSSLQSYTLRTVASVLEQAAPTDDSLPHAYTVGDFDGDGHQDILVFTRDTLSDTTIAVRMYAGGYAGDLVADRTVTLSGWEDFCVHALRGIGDLDGDGTSDLVCSSADDAYASQVLVLWGHPGFFFQPMRVSAVNLPGAAGPILARELAITPLRDLSGDGRSELVIQLADPGASLVVYP